MDKTEVGSTDAMFTLFSAESSMSVQLVKFSLKTAGNLPKTTLNTTKRALIDQYGLQVGGSAFPWSHSVYRHAMQQQSSGNSTITYFGDQVSSTTAAFVNGCLGHAQDFDDSHQEAQTHPGSVVIAAAIAAGESVHASGREVLDAIAIGMEVMLRLAHALCPACIEGGHHTPPTLGPFGSAIACGILLGLSEKQLVNALGICGSYAGGLVQYSIDGGSVKRIHTGLGARAGLEAVLLAKEGLTGPIQIIEGKKGVIEVFGRGKAYPERLFDEIGNTYLLDTIMFKPYNCCYLIHPAIEGFLQLCEIHGISHDAIESVTVGMSAFSISHAGTIKRPTDALGAQFSTSFTLALSLMQGPPRIASYTNAVLQDNGIHALAEKISVYQDEQANTEFPKKNGCVINITKKDGNTFTIRIREPKGSPTNLLTEEDVRDKFFNNVETVMNEEQSHALYKALSNFEKLSDICQLKECTVVKQKQITAKL